LKRVIAILPGPRREVPNGCDIYRALMPYRLLNQQPGWQAHPIFFVDLWEQYRQTGRGVWANLIRTYDLFVFPRLFAGSDNAKQGMIEFINLIQAFGKKIIYEVDDDYSNEYRQVVPGDAISLAAKMDAVTVTTPLLADMMKSKTRRPTYILPNCIDSELWRDSKLERFKKDKHSLVIGLTGSPTHKADWEVLREIVPPLLAANPNLKLLLMGYEPEYFADLPNNQVIRMPFTRYEGYLQVIRNCDVILAPVVPDDGFNLSKSPIKGIEGQAASRPLPSGGLGGAAVIATDNPVYRLAIQDQENGLLVEHTPEAWDVALHRVISDTTLREKLQRTGHKTVYKRFDIQHRWKWWADAYADVLSA